MFELDEQDVIELASKYDFETCQVHDCIILLNKYKLAFFDCHREFKNSITLKEYSLICLESIVQAITTIETSYNHSKGVLTVGAGTEQEKQIQFSKRVIEMYTKNYDEFVFEIAIKYYLVPRACP